MEIPKGRTLGKGRSKDQALRQDLIGIFQDHKEDPEGWREEVRSDGLGGEGERVRVQKALWALEICSIFSPNEIRS